MGHFPKITLIIALLVFSLIQVLPVIRSGLNYSYGIGFWGPNGHDAIWHLSLINHIDSPFHLIVPAYSGEKLVNYHPFYDIVLALIAKITTLDASLLHFQIFPLVTSLLYLYLTYSIVNFLTKNHTLGIFSMFLATLSNSLGPLYHLLVNHSLGGETMFWSMQPISTQLNPPLALSYVFLLLLVYLVATNQDRFLPVLLILTLTPITKVYTGVAVFVFYGLYSLSSLSQRQYRPVLKLFVSLVVALFVFLYYNPPSSPLLLFKPLWLVESMVQSADRLYLPRIASAIFNLKQVSPYQPKLLLLYLFTTILFLVGNFSLRAIPFLFYFQTKKTRFFKLLLATIGILSLCPLLLVQKSTSWNTIQFLYPALILSNLLLCLFLSPIHLFTRNVIILVCVIYFSFASIDTFQNYLGNPAPSAIPPSEITALQFLSSQPRGIVLSYLYDQFTRNEFISTPLPLYAYETTSYLSAYTPHTTYLADEMNLANSGYDVASRRKAAQDFFAQTSIYQDRGFLVNNHIDYLYLTGTQRSKTILDTNNLYLSKIFENDSTIIYRVQR